MKSKILEDLKKSILAYDSKEATRIAEDIIKNGISPLEAVDSMTIAIKEVGDAFAKGDLYLPDLIGAADAMSAASPILEAEMKKRNEKTEGLGVVVIGTVFGDIHTIGKTLVSTLLSAEGFSVKDLGINISAEGFIKAIKQYKPNILAMSALLTTTASEQRKVIEALKEEGIRNNIKVMVGGGPITQEFAETIGADGYASTAPDAVKLAKKLIGK